MCKVDKPDHKRISCLLFIFNFPSNNKTELAPEPTSSDLLIRNKRTDFIYIKMFSIKNIYNLS